MKKCFLRFLKRYLPVQYTWLRRNWRYIPPFNIYDFFYKKHIGYKNRDLRLNKEKSVIQKFFSNNLIIRNGVFKGLNYTHSAFGSTILPKIIGSYEEPIAKWIQDVKYENYDQIIDIGSAEGYYVTGFASILKSKIIGYELNQYAIEENRKLISLNKKNIQSEIQLINKFCTHKELKAQIKNSRSLIFLDVEGAEVDILQPELIPDLINSDLIVECHDALKFGIIYTLIERFSNTHEIELKVDFPRTLSLYPELSNLTTEEQQFILDERRPKGMTWARFKSLSNSLA